MDRPPPARAVSSPQALCHWRYADGQRRWATACHHRITRTGEDNLFAFCPYCGRRLLMDRRGDRLICGATAINPHRCP